MRRCARLISRHFGPAASHVGVHVELRWYWRLFWILLLLSSGFLLAYWFFADKDAAALQREISRLQQENTELRTQAIHVERQQQVSTVAQGSLAKDLTSLQEENVRLKEDMAFYKSILEESSGVAAIKLHDFKVSHSGRVGEYQYRLLLVQSGKHDKNVQGNVQLTLVGVQNGRSMTQPLTVSKVNFKYYQPLEGKFVVPTAMTVESLQASFMVAGAGASKLTQTITIPK